MFGWLFGRKPKKKMRRKNRELPLWSNAGMCAYVMRTAPTSLRGKRLPKRLARIDGIHEFPENLIGDVALLHGDYTGRVFPRDKRIYFGTYRFSLPWDPLIDGQEIERKEER